MDAKKSTFSVTFFIKKTALKKKTGKAPIVGRINVNSNVSQFATQIEIEPCNWNTKKNRAKGKDCEKINTILDDIENSIHSHYHKMRVNHIMVTAEKLRNAFLGKCEGVTFLIAYFKRYLEEAESRVGKDMVKATYGKQTLACKRIQEFLKAKYKVSDIYMEELNLKFAKSFFEYLKNELEYKTNSARTLVQYLKMIVALAHEEKLINSNPFLSFKVKKEKTAVRYLTENELLRIMNKQFSVSRLEKVRDLFIFSCFTGLAYSDLKKFSKNDLKGLEEKSVWVKGKRKKTGGEFEVPLFEIPKLILQKYEGKLPQGKLLPVISNQKLNGYLKEIQDICNIDLTLSTHVARHTFATTVTLEKGVSMESVSKMLGHNDMRSTQIYAHVTNKRIQNDTQHLHKEFETLETTYKDSLAS